jgi:hypothetical protein
VKESEEPVAIATTGGQMLSKVAAAAT